RLGKIELAPQKYLHTFHRFIDTAVRPSDDQLRKAINELLAEGAKAIAVSEAFSVDAPENEMRALAIAHEMGVLATAGCEVSQLYGLKVRTRTAVINASMLPKMLESADMTESSVKAAGIKAPVMIMRSDGGVMDIEAMRKKPILTMLSGPAAGVAAAMMFLNITDGVFLEVGGTSTDISAIMNGRAQVRPGEIGGHKVYMRTLDVRTVGVAGGSLPRLSQRRIVAVGPRSAHIAGLKYSSFSPDLKEARIKTIKPKEGDPDDYVAVQTGDGQPSFCITPTCAANLLGLVPAGDCAEGDLSPVKAAFAALTEATGAPAEQNATQILHLAAEQCIPVVKQLIKDHKLDAQLVSLVGGGGGAAALVPFIAKQMNLRHWLADYADVISAIGVALALIRETVERQVINPSNEDILKIRAEAHAAVAKMGAAQDTIDVHVEVDSRTNTVRATAFGATSMTERKAAARLLNEDEALALVAESMRVQQSSVRLSCQTDYYQVFAADTTRMELFGLIPRRQTSLRVLDKKGVIRLQLGNGSAEIARASDAEGTIGRMADEHAQWGDAGKVIPDIMLLAGPKVVDLSGVLNLEQVQALARAELESFSRDSNIVVLAKLG
ncbi:MAG TPA: hydantoinase/oxoprolinase family protein, partial [Chroococcales cyanobacterium]